MVKRVPHIYAHAGYYKTMSETMYIAGSFGTDMSTVGDPSLILMPASICLISCGSVPGRRQPEPFMSKPELSWANILILMINST